MVPHLGSKTTITGFASGGNFGIKAISQPFQIGFLYYNKQDSAIGCSAFMEVKIGQDRSRKVNMDQDRSR